MAYCLRETGAIQAVGKLRGAWLYEQPPGKPRDFRSPRRLAWWETRRLSEEFSEH